MKTTGRITIIALVVYAVLFLGQLWFSLFDASNFVKISITFAIVIGVLGITSLIKREYLQDESLKKDGFID